MMLLFFLSRLNFLSQLPDKVLMKLFGKEISREAFYRLFLTYDFFFITCVFSSFHLDVQLKIMKKLTKQNIQKWKDMIE